MPPNPRVASSAPSQSMWPFASSSRLSGTCRRAMAITTTAMGTLMKNTIRQDACSMSQPPSGGPMAVLIAVKLDQVPMALPRRSSENEAPMMARLPGVSIAAPMPWRTRAATSAWMLGERPHATDARPKTTTPVAQRPVDQEQRGEHQRIGLEHPLDRSYGRAELRLQHRQSDADDRPV